MMYIGLKSRISHGTFASRKQYTPIAVSKFFSCNGKGSLDAPSHIAGVRGDGRIVNNAIGISYFRFFANNPEQKVKKLNS